MAYTRKPGPYPGLGFPATVLKISLFTRKWTAGITNAKSSAKAVAHGIPASNPVTDAHISKPGPDSGTGFQFKVRTVPSSRESGLQEEPFGVLILGCKVQGVYFQGLGFRVEGVWVQVRRVQPTDRGHDECKQQREGCSARDASVESLVKG